jgi:hypothetical protein
VIGIASTFAVAVAFAAADSELLHVGNLAVAVVVAAERVLLRKKSLQLLRLVVVT